MGTVGSQIGATCTGFISPQAPGNNLEGIALGANESDNYGTQCVAGDLEGNGRADTLTGPTHGVCLHYCSVSADCDSTGTWVNKRFSF